MTPGLRSRARWPLIAALITVPRLASAAGDGQTSEDAERERSAAYTEGVALANAGRWEEAEKRFRRVVAIRAAPPALFTLGQAEEHTGELATAERTYDAALVGARAAGNTEVVEACRRALAVLGPRIPRVVVRLAGPAPGASVTIDGASVAPDQATKLDPGAHVVAASAPGRKPFETRAMVAPGQSLEVTLQLEALPAPAPAPAPTQADVPTSPGEARPGLPLGPLVLGGAGLVTSIVGIVVRITGQSSYDSANARCSPAGCPQQSTVDAGNGARTQMLIGTIVAGVGVAAVAGAGAWWLSVSMSQGSPGATVTARF
jgi:hypothetical protein